MAVCHGLVSPVAAPDYVLGQVQLDSVPQFLHSPACYVHMLGDRV